MSGLVAEVATVHPSGVRNEKVPEGCLWSWGSGGGSGESAPAGRTGGEATFAYASFPDYLDPALSYTVAGTQALYQTALKRYLNQ